MFDEQKIVQLEGEIGKKNSQIKLLKKVAVEVDKFREKKERANSAVKLSNLDQKLKES